MCDNSGVWLSYCIVLVLFYILDVVLGVYLEFFSGRCVKNNFMNRKQFGIA